MKCRASLSTHSAVCPFANGVIGNNPFRLDSWHKTTFVGSTSFSVMYGCKLSKKRSTICLDLFHSLNKSRDTAWDLCFACAAAGGRCILRAPRLRQRPPAKTEPTTGSGHLRGSKYQPSQQALLPFHVHRWTERTNQWLTRTMRHSAAHLCMHGVATYIRYVLFKDLCHLLSNHLVLERGLTVQLHIYSAFAPNYYSFNMTGPQMSSKHLP